jgi:hypothetical protein
MKNYRGWPCEVLDSESNEWIACKFVSLCLSPMPEPIVQIKGRMPWFATWGSVRGLPPRKELEAYFKQDETPPNRWSQIDQQDPHGSHYNCERAKLTLGTLTDDELANAAFMNYDHRPSVDDIVLGKAYMPIVYMTAVKERIRWLSRALTKADAELQVTKRLAMAGDRKTQTECLAELDKLSAMPAKPVTMQIRMYRGSLSDSIKTREEIPATFRAACSYIRKYTENMPLAQLELHLYTELYSEEVDNRIGWAKTYSLMYKAGGIAHPIAFTTEPIED